MHSLVEGRSYLSVLFLIGQSEYTGVYVVEMGWDIECMYVKATFRSQTFFLIIKRLGKRDMGGSPGGATLIFLTRMCEYVVRKTDPF